MTNTRVVVGGMLMVCGSMGGAGAALGQTAAAEAGPIIAPYGAVYPVLDTDFPTRTDLDYRVVFDVSDAPTDVKAENPRVETVARFLNMHAQAGVPAERMRLALVLHGDAGRHALHPRAYRSRFAADNPNLPFIEALARAGVEIYLCGQTAAHRGYAKTDLAAPVRLALSAMTVLVTLQQEGYALVAF